MYSLNILIFNPVLNRTNDTSGILTPAIPLICMKRSLPLIILVLFSFLASAQVYNNEWINYSLTYYKFKVGATGIYRITQPELAAIGLGNSSSENYKLWRNGEEVAIYTSAVTGPLPPSGYIEFYGERNDGKADKVLYKYDSLQMCDNWSILTDTASYFLTVTNSGTNKRLINTPNNVSGNSLPAEAYFMYRLGKYYKEFQNQGYGIDFGEMVHSSSFENGEGWTAYMIYPGNTLQDNNTPLYYYPAGPSPSIVATGAGNYSAGRNVQLAINGNVLQTNYVNSFDITHFNATNLNASVFSGDAANVQFTQDGNGSDNVVISHYELTYPRQYNFGGLSRFNFELPASGPKYLTITNFISGGIAPVLYDLANSQRFTAVVNSDTLKFVLPSSTVTRKLVLSSVAPGSILQAGNMSTVNFIDYSIPANQGNYLIITNSLLFDNGAGINYVESYRQYRASAAGGNYNAKIINIDQLIDQFAFGIKHHPSSIRNFTSYILDKFSTQPKYLFLVGKGLDYTQFRKNESDINTAKLALVPTFGWPASDNLLGATRTGSTSRIPIGRLSAINGNEVRDYLNKTIQFESVNASNPQTVAGKAWMKNTAQITGAINDPSLYTLISGYMQGYRQVIGDTSFGGKVYDFNQNSGQYTAIGSSITIDSLFSQGLSLLTYFGHSSPNTLEFNLDNPAGYNNTGKYPLIIINGCLSGDLFSFDTLRSINKGTLSEQYIFSPQKGSIGFIADTHFGLPQQLNYFTSAFTSNIANTMYGKGIGDIMKSTMEFMNTNYGYDFVARCHEEEITYHGDPAIKLNPSPLPDYTLQDSMISLTPSVISVADEKILATIKILNIGKAVNDSLTIRIQQQLPDSSIITLSTRRIKATLYQDTLQLSVNLNPLKHKGLNKIIVTVDPLNLIAEMSEVNNTAYKSFMVLEDEIRPVYPYNYSIVSNASGLTLYGSTANPRKGVEQYVMEMDTTRLFNSSAKIQKTVSSSGGMIKFMPGVSLTDSTVYYWRLAPGPVNTSTRWLGSSFTCLYGSDKGFDQSHFYQYTDDDYTSMFDDSTTHKFTFQSKIRKLLARVGTYPYYDWDQNNINLDNDQVDYWGCVWNSLQFYVFDSLTLTPWQNYNVPGGGGRFGSWASCNAPRHFFDFPTENQEYRRRAMNFFDSIPSGSVVLIRDFTYGGNTSFIDTWKSDTSTFGSGHSLWHSFKQYGLNGIDGYTFNQPYVFIFRKKGTSGAEVRQVMGPLANTHIIDTALISSRMTDGTVQTPWLGPAKSWKNFKWNETADSSSTSHKYFEIISQDINGNDSVLVSVYNAKDTSISFINASVHPYLKLKVHTSDPVQAKAIRLKYWMLTADLYPEGAVAPNIVFQSPDSLNADDTLHFRIAFKNISEVAFDSIKLRLTITDNTGADHVYLNQQGARLRPLVANDSVVIMYDIPAAAYVGQNQLMLDVNPDNDQPEQFHFNNVLYKNWYVSNPVCPNSNTNFYCGNSLPGSTFQWQLNTGTGYNNINNSTGYSGATSNTLTVLNASSSMYGYRYRCIITNNSVPVNSNEYILKFSLTWNGSVSTAWETPGNWNCGIVPDTNTDVIIKTGVPNFPHVNSNVTCRSLTVRQGSTITVITGATISLSGPPGN